MRAVFLDRDGVVNANVTYPDDGRPEAPRRVEDFRLLPGALAAMAALRRAGWRLILVSNQPNQALGKASAADHAAIHAALLTALAAAGITLTAAYYCLHHPAGSEAGLGGPCRCRKPAPAFLFEARDAHGIDLGASWMVGDRDSDIACGRAAGVRTILVRGEGPPSEPPADAVVPDLAAAARVILGEDRAGGGRR